MLISKFDTNEIEKRIEEFENKLQITLPEEYIRFIIRYNGGFYRGWNNTYCRKCMGRLYYYGNHKKTLWGNIFLIS